MSESRNPNKWLNSSRKRRNYIKTRAADTVDQIISEKNNLENINKRREIHGNGKYRDIGIIARLFNYYVIVPETLTIEDDKISFYDGYINYANTQLSLMCLTNKIPDKIIQIIEEKKIPIEIPSVEEILYNVGMKDAKEGYVVENEIIKNNIYYQKGYNELLENQKSKGR